MAEETVVAETRPQMKEEKGLLWFLSEMNLWSLQERYAASTTPLEAYIPERLAKLRKTAAVIGAGEAAILVSGVPAFYACLQGILHPFAGELSHPWNLVFFAVITFWPFLVTTAVIWFAVPKIVGEVTASIAKNFVFLRGIVFLCAATVAAAFQAVLLPRLITPEAIYSCTFLPKPLALKGYLFWRNFIAVLRGAAPWIPSGAIILASLGILPVLVKAYKVIREREVYEEIRGEV